MGMRGHLQQIMPAELEKLQRNPEGVEKLVHGNQADPAQMMAVLQRTQKIALDARASGAINDPAEKEHVRALILKELAGVGVNIGGRFDDGSTKGGLNLEKSWHVLHYLLTGKAEEAPPPLGTRFWVDRKSAIISAMDRRDF
jgi:hypothetical protein